MQKMSGEKMENENEREKRGNKPSRNYCMYIYKKMVIVVH